MMVSINLLLLTWLSPRVAKSSRDTENYLIRCFKRVGFRSIRLASKGFWPVDVMLGWSKRGRIWIVAKLFSATSSSKTADSNRNSEGRGDGVAEPSKVAHPGIYSFSNTGNLSPFGMERSQ